MKQSVADTAQQAKRKVQEEFDRMQPRSQDDQAWTQGKIASNTPAVQQQPSFHGSGRKIVTETQPESQGRIPSNTSAARPGVGSSSQGEGESHSGEFADRQGRKAEGQGWKEPKAQAEQKAGKVEEKASSAVDQVKDAVKSVPGVSHMLLTCNRITCLCLTAYIITSLSTCGCAFVISLLNLVFSSGHELCSRASQHCSDLSAICLRSFWPLNTIYHDKSNNDDKHSITNNNNSNGNKSYNAFELMMS